MKKLDDEFNAKWKAKGITLEVHHELGCKIGKPLVLAKDFADPEKKGCAIAILDSLTITDLHGLHADVNEKSDSLMAQDMEADAMERLLCEIDARIASAEAITHNSDDCSPVRGSTVQGHETSPLNLVNFADDLPSPKKFKAMMETVATLDDAQLVEQLRQLVRAVANEDMCSLFYACADYKYRFRLNSIHRECLNMLMRVREHSETECAVCRRTLGEKENRSTIWWSEEDWMVQGVICDHCAEIGANSAHNVPPKNESEADMLERIDVLLHRAEDDNASES